MRDLVVRELRGRLTEDEVCEILKIVSKSMRKDRKRYGAVGFIFGFLASLLIISWL